MRMPTVNGVMAFGLLACGGNESPAPPEPSAQHAAGSAATVAPRPIVEVNMTGDGSTRAAFEPSVLTIKPGTAVRFINRSGGPHNVTFYSDSIPAGAAIALAGDLTGPFLTKPNETYLVSFAGAPPGTYKGYCMLHVSRGMKITITVE